MQSFKGIKLLVITENHGVTITSVMIATVLMGVVAAVGAQLFSNQASALETVVMIEERAVILKHYGEVLVSGWDNTKQRNNSLASSLIGPPVSIDVYTRTGTLPTIPASGLYLTDSLYTAATSTTGWWKVTVTASKLTGSPLSDPLISVTLRVTFIPSKHPNVKMKLADLDNVIFFHHNIKDSNTDCHDNKSIIQYDFISNFKKCSTWAMVKISSSGGSGNALLGFDPTEFTAIKKYQLHPIYDGVIIDPTSCAASKYITSISSSGVVTCSSSHTTSTGGGCTTGQIRSISSSGVSCELGPPGPTGPPGPRGPPGTLSTSTSNTATIYSGSCPSSCSAPGIVGEAH